MKSFMTIAALAVCAAAIGAPAPANAQGTGFFEWSLSSSATNMYVNSDASPGAGQVVTLYLWNHACAPGAEAGMSAAEFDLNATGALALAFTPLNGALNAGAFPALLLAVGGCPEGPGTLGSILLQTTAAEFAVGLAPSLVNGWAGTVDCVSPVPNLYFWPGSVRLTGYATSGYAGTAQDHGNGCTANPVTTQSWGAVKSLYR